MINDCGLGLQPLVGLLVLGIYQLLVDRHAKGLQLRAE